MMFADYVMGYVLKSVAPPHHRLKELFYERQIRPVWKARDLPRLAKS